METLQKDRHKYRPKSRRLRVYAFDPILGRILETSQINQVTLKVHWEYDQSKKEDILAPGPVGEYVEVVDYDPSSRCFYEPVNLDDPYLLAQDGLPPSEGIPQFHQQMVYAVVMNTVQYFERALGRLVLWSPKKIKRRDKEEYRFVKRLRIYPHALRESNAFYSPEKKALLFGYFAATSTKPGRILPGGVVFSCLSHDIVVHETTHALVDGLHHKYIEPSNPDVLAFHEAFADIVALFQHFSLPEVLHHQIAKTRGDLSKQNLLAQLAQQFGQAVGRRGALRDSLGEYDKETQEWKPKKPDPSKLLSTFEPHARGSILVAALFDAFLTIYKSRIEDLVRIATGGTGVLPPGDIHPDLVNRLAQEAAKSARHILQMCIRALDYCPPVDITFGDFLRALITADAELVSEDNRGYRIAMIEAFRRWGIYPLDVRTLSAESLRWYEPSNDEQKYFQNIFPDREAIQNLALSLGMCTDRTALYNEMKSNKEKIKKWLTSRKFRRWLSSDEGKKLSKIVGLELGRNAPPTVFLDNDGWPEVNVDYVRPAIRQGPDGQVLTNLVIGLTQRRRGYLKPETQEKADKSEYKRLPKEDFIFRGGGTLLVDLESGKTSYIISKRINSDKRLIRQRRFYLTPDTSLRATYFKDFPLDETVKEPFALLHRSFPAQGGGSWQ